MWLFTPFGFYSVVSDRDRPDRVLVRGRVLADMEALKAEYLPGLEIIGGAGTDYAWRAWVDRAQWEAVATRHLRRHRLRQLQERRPRAPGPRSRSRLPEDLGRDVHRPDGRPGR